VAAKDGQIQVTETGKERRSLEDIWKIIWRRKWVVGLFVLAAMAAVTVGILLQTPVFEASATLHVKEQIPSVLGNDFWGTGISDLSPAAEINTQMEILKSTSVLRDAVVTSGLAAGFVSKAGLTDEERVRLAADSLRRSLSVSSITNTRLIRVAVRSKDPDLAMRTANAICQAFIKRNVESKRSEANAVLAFVSDQVSQVSASLDKVEEDLLRYKQSEHITVLADEAKLKLDRLAQLESQYQQAKLDRQILGARINGVQQISPGDAALESIAATPSVKALQDRLTAIEGELSRLGGDESRAAQLRTQADSLKKDIQAETERALGAVKGTSGNSVLQLQLAEYKSRDIILAAQEEAYHAQIVANEADINRLSAQEVSLFKLERTRRINDELYSALMKAKNEAQIEAISQIGSIDVIDPAEAPLHPVSPRKEENLIVGFILSLLMGMCFTFLLEYFDNSVKSEEEVKKLLELPLIGHIPRFQTNGVMPARKRAGGDYVVSTLFTRDNPESTISEAFRLLRMNLFFIELDKGLKTIAVTSAVPGEGKTTIAANLSVTLAAQEERVLIMDADLRAPAVHKIFDLPQAPGFTNIFTDRVGYRDLIRQVRGAPNLGVITAGLVPPNPAEIIGSSKMKELIGELRDSYDRVIFDTPPVLGATDAVVLASLVDGTLLALRTGRMDRRSVKRMSEIFGNTRAVILGGVLNGVDIGEMRYSYRYYSSAEENRRKD
jgi:succinoglycan biosynthesis transport protein ExoP